MVEYTSAQAAKLLRKLNDELLATLRMENQSKDFLAALGEEPETVRPPYDFHKTAAKIEALEGRIRALKHALNVFNTTTVVPGVNLTVDQVLLLIPQLTSRCDKLRSMMSKLPKTREGAAGVGRNAVIDYRYLNYDAADAEAAFYASKALLDEVQLQLNLVNSTVTFPIDEEIVND